MMLVYWVNVGNRGGDTGTRGDAAMVNKSREHDYVCYDLKISSV